MCGIAGCFHAQGTPSLGAWASRASAQLAHRGPDDASNFSDAHATLVFRRLALIDLTPAGNQPMPNEDASVLLVFNGEIYNHRELRAWLTARGHVFRGHSDTEVIVHLYEEEGEGFAARLRGMFAIAIYDIRARRLVLARDRFGIKPLFIRAGGHGLAFASEIKALLSLPGPRPTLDRQACLDFLGLGYIPEPATGFVEISALPPGHLLVSDERGQVVKQFASVMPKPSEGGSVAVQADRVAELLTRSVERQREADVPVATLLSGGIDSTLLLAAAAKGGSAPVSFTVQFPDANYDETAAAAEVARASNSEHHIIPMQGHALDADSVCGILRHFDQPYADTSCLPMFSIASQIRGAGIICALSGDGGDEVFGGYARFWRTNRVMDLMAFPPIVARALAAVGHLLTPVTRDQGRQLAKGASLVNAARQDPAELLRGYSSYLSEHEKAALVRPDARAGLVASTRLFRTQDYKTGNALEDMSARVTENLLHVGLPSDMLRKVDMMSMKASIEVRVPMLDEDLVEAGLSLSHALKTNGREGKIVLREVARRWLPPEISRRPKQGFSLPVDVMIGDDFHEMLQDLLLGPGARTRNILDQALVAEWLSLFRRARSEQLGGSLSRGGLYQRVFILLALELWLRDQGFEWA